jgi:Flp pilus assembly protein TadG
MNLFTRLKPPIADLARKERGSAIVELAIVFPILLLFFVGTAELGRLFYTYTTLAKATKAGARYLSNSRDFTSSDADTVTAAKLKAQSLVVCGYEDCTGKVAIVPGLSTSNPASNVTVTLTTQTEGTSLVRYVKVEITGYTYARGVFTFDGVTGATGANSVYKALTPATRMRYML